ncbi:MAG: YebC/PmpR family DNA-binding transcriptional regulator [Dehalococcoidales bacterium]|nr:YebC/PmpR family DNA-binding transcriptional regulator [Dehalococcoidales bacterium]
MSGHSKWANIKNQKGAADAKRGQIFTKLTREIILSVREHGGNPEANFHLRLAIQKARDNNMPLDNIERAIKKGEGNLEGVTLDEFILEGYGPGGAAVLVEVLSDNRNRTVQEVRNMFTRSGGGLGEVGSVNWQFEQKGIITIDLEKGMNADDISMMAIDAGAEDVKTEKDYIEIYTRLEDMETIRKVLEQNNVKVSSAGMSKVAKNTVELDESTSLQVLRLIDKLENFDDVRSVWSNVEFSDEVMEKYQG